jgi:TPR repeat protein
MMPAHLDSGSPTYSFLLELWSSICSVTANKKDSSADEGVEKNIGEAVKWLTRAAEIGDAHAQLYLAGL